MAQMSEQCAQQAGTVADRSLALGPTQKEQFIGLLSK